MKQAERQAWARFYETRQPPESTSESCTSISVADSQRAATRRALSGPLASPESRVGRLGERATVSREGHKFRSRLEADRWKELQFLQKSGEVAYTLRQVPFDVAPGVIYRLDFLVVWRPHPQYGGQEITYEETKGFLTDTSRIKIASVQERYGIKITILTRKDVSR